MTDIDTLLQMIDDCEARESRLTEWEIGFLDAVRDWIAHNKPVTESQDEKINAIWDRVTDAG